jgi:hypothetical protein
MSMTVDALRYNYSGSPFTRGSGKMEEVFVPSSRIIINRAGAMYANHPRVEDLQRDCTRFTLSAETVEKAKACAAGRLYLEEADELSFLASPREAESRAIARRLGEVEVLEDTPEKLQVKFAYSKEEGVPARRREEAVLLSLIIKRLDDREPYESERFCGDALLLEFEGEDQLSIRVVDASTDEARSTLKEQLKSKPRAYAWNFHI